MDSGSSFKVKGKGKVILKMTNLVIDERIALIYENNRNENKRRIGEGAVN